jgi:hypothetical protein
MVRTFKRKEEEMGGACGTYEGKGNAFRALVGKLKKETTWKTET